MPWKVLSGETRAVDVGCEFIFARDPNVKVFNLRQVFVLLRQVAVSLDASEVHHGCG